MSSKKDIATQERIVNEAFEAYETKKAQEKAADEAQELGEEGGEGGVMEVQAVVEGGVMEVQAQEDAPSAAALYKIYEKEFAKLCKMQLSGVKAVSSLLLEGGDSAASGLIFKIGSIPVVLTTLEYCVASETLKKDFCDYKTKAGGITIDMFDQLPGIVLHALFRQIEANEDFVDGSTTIKVKGLRDFCLQSEKINRNIEAWLKTIADHAYYLDSIKSILKTLVGSKMDLSGLGAFVEHFALKIIKEEAGQKQAKKDLKDLAQKASAAAPGSGAGGSK